MNKKAYLEINKSILKAMQANDWKIAEGNLLDVINHQLEMLSRKNDTVDSSTINRIFAENERFFGSIDGEIYLKYEERPAWADEFFGWLSSNSLTSSDLSILVILFLIYRYDHSYGSLRNKHSNLFYFRYDTDEFDFGYKVSSAIREVFERNGVFLELDSAFERSLFPERSKITSRSDLRGNNKILRLLDVVQQIDQSSITDIEFDELLISPLIKRRNRGVRQEISFPPILAQVVTEIISKYKSTRISEYPSRFSDSIVNLIGSEKRQLITLQSGETFNEVVSVFRLILLGFEDVRFQKNLFLGDNDHLNDAIISLPPWGRLSKRFWEETSGNNFVEIRSLEELYIKTCINNLEKDGVAVIVVPDGVLFRQDKHSVNFRENLVKEGLLEGVISLPDRIFPQFNVQTNLLVLSKRDTKTPYFLNARHIERESDFDEKGALIYATKLFNLKYEQLEISRFVDLLELKKNNYSLVVDRYISPEYYPDNYIRSEKEEIIRLKDLSSKLKLDRVQLDRKYGFLNMGDLTDEPADFLIDISRLPKRKNYKSKVSLLDRDALLIGKVGHNLKPSYFKYQGEPIYLGHNVLALEVNEEVVSVEYLISELNSDFVKKQAGRLPTGAVIPNIKQSDIFNILVRLPSLNKQIIYFNEWIGSIARSKIKEVESLSADLKFIEKDVFSSFAHDFGKLLLKVTSNIEVIKAFLHYLNDEGRISLNESVFGDEKVIDGDQVGKVIERLEQNNKRSCEFLEDSVNSFTLEQVVTEPVDLKELLIDWKARQNTDVSIRILNQEKAESSSSKEAETISSQSLLWDFASFTVPGNKSALLSVLNNFLDNAINYGFEGLDKDPEFLLFLEYYYEENEESAKPLSGISLHIANNGHPFPEDFSCEDFFRAGHKGSNSKGKGIGGRSIKRNLDAIGAKISCTSSQFIKELYPVQFQIDFKSEHIDE